MARKSASHSRRTSSPVPSTPLAHVMESESERDEQATIVAKAAQDLGEMEKLEAERNARFQEAEKELMNVLETDGVSEHVRKRQLTRLFDRFRLEYMQLSTRFRENMRLQRKIMDKCLEMKNELVLSAIKVKTAKQLQDEEMKNLIYYRDECEHAWKAANVCEERERDAIRIIDELKGEIESLHGQVKALLGLETADQRRQVMAKPKPTVSLSEHEHDNSSLEIHSLSPVRSPVKRTAFATTGATSSSPLSPSKLRGSAAAKLQDPPPSLMSFDEWKLSTRVWSSPMDHASHKPSTPSQQDLVLQQRKQEIARCVSVPTLQPTPMERAATAVCSSSPSRREQERRATTSVGSRRTGSSSPLPSVSLRKPPPPS